MILIGGLRILEVTTEFSVDAKRTLGDQKRRFIRAWAVVEFNDKSIRVCSDTPMGAISGQILVFMGLSGDPRNLYPEDCATLYMWLQEMKEDMVEAIKASEIPSDALIKKLREQKHELMRQKRIQDVRNAQKNELSNIFIRFDFSMEEVTELWKVAQVTKTMEN